MEASEVPDQGDALLRDAHERVGRPRNVPGGVFASIPRADVLALHDAGYSWRQIAERYGVSRSTIWAVRNLDRWPEAERVEPVSLAEGLRAISEGMAAIAAEREGEKLG